MNQFGLAEKRSTFFRLVRRGGGQNLFDLIKLKCLKRDFLGDLDNFIFLCFSAKSMRQKCQMRHQGDKKF